MTNGHHMRFLPIAVIVLLMLLSMAAPRAQQRIIRVEGGKKLGAQQTDSLRGMDPDTILRVRADLAGIPTDSLRRIMADSLRSPADSMLLAKNDSLFYAKGDSLMISRQVNHVADTTEADNEQKKNERGKEISRFEKQRFNFARFTQDTLKPGAVTLLSFVPGLGQVYNRQAWKVPIVYGAIGGFAVAGTMFGRTYKDHKAEYNRLVNLNMPPEMINHAKRKMQSAGGARTLMYSMAAASYLYSIADATLNYRGISDPIRQATVLAAVFPGMGFVYTRTYWRLPIYYGGFIALATVIDYNNRSFMRYRKAYTALTDNDPTTTDEFNGRYSPQVILNIRNSYRRDRDFAILATAAAYLVSVVDTHVIASLKNWDVSDDLSVIFEPTIIDNRMQRASTVPQGYGVAVKIRF